MLPEGFLGRYVSSALYRNLAEAMTVKRVVLTLTCFSMFSGFVFSQALPPDVKAKVEAKASELKSLSTDSEIVGAVKSYNASPPPESKAMTNEKWNDLTVLDPFVRSFSKNPLGEHLKSLKDESIAEIFVSGADGGKVAFLAKTTSWNHRGKPKHDVPMTGKVWIGPVAVDESTGQQEVQIGLPVLDSGKPIGSIVVGLKIASLR
jgi:hypothetical protein